MSAKDTLKKLSQEYYGDDPAAPRILLVRGTPDAPGYEDLIDAVFGHEDGPSFDVLVSQGWTKALSGTALAEGSILVEGNAFQYYIVGKDGPFISGATSYGTRTATTYAQSQMETEDD